MDDDSDDEIAEFRQGRRPALKLGSIDIAATAAMLLAGTVPWFLLGFLQSVYPTLAFWTPFAVTPQMRALGMLLAIAASLNPSSNRTESSRRPGAGGRKSFFVRRPHPKRGDPAALGQHGLYPLLRSLADGRSLACT